MIESVAARLRREFDEAFARAVATPPQYDAFLIVRVADARFALRMGEIASIHADKVVVRAPSANRAFAGIASVRGALAPVYDLGLLLGRGASKKRCLVIAKTAFIGVLVDAFAEHVRVERNDSAGALDVAGAPVIDLTAALDAARKE